MTQPEKLAPIVRVVSVSWKPEEAYRRFVNEFSSWWPVKTHSIGGPRIKRLVFEAKVAGGFMRSTSTAGSSSGARCWSSIRRAGRGSRYTLPDPRALRRPSSCSFIRKFRVPG